MVERKAPLRLSIDIPLLSLAIRRRQDSRKGQKALKTHQLNSSERWRLAADDVFC